MKDWNVGDHFTSPSDDYESDEMCRIIGFSTTREGFKYVCV